MNLLIVESPSKSKTISKYLGKNFTVLSSMGHVRSLPSKPGSVDPNNDFDMVYEQTPHSLDSIKKISSIVKGVDNLYLATDPDREGEAISWHVVEILKKKKYIKSDTKIKRVAFYELTKDAILHAVNNPRDIDLNLVQAQQTRQALDYLVGFTLSPLLWRKLSGCRSAGRVQSVALKLISEREREILSFAPKEYWSINLSLLKGKNVFDAKLIDFQNKKVDKFFIKSKKDADDIVNVVKNQNFYVKKIEKKQQKNNPYPPFNTSSLQQEAYKKLGFSVKKTMQIAQKIYEGVEINGESVGLISYMRTDSVVINENVISDIRSLIEKKYGSKYLSKKIRTYITKTKNAQESHEAIRPTNVKILPEDIRSDLSEDQYKLYSLIWKRSVSSQMSSAILDLLSIVFSSTEVSAKSNFSFLGFDGYYLLYKDSEHLQDKNQIDFNLSEGIKVILQNVKSKQHFTEPPPRFTEASIVKTLEELGIGRPSTYAGIISIIQDRGYVNVSNKRFVPDSKGMVLSVFLDIFFKKYVDYNFTANLEEELDQIANGNSNWKNALKSFWKHFNLIIQEVKNKDTKEVHEKLLKVLIDNNPKVIPQICPVCKKNEVQMRLSKFGPFLSCKDYLKCEYKQAANLSAKKDDLEDSFISKNNFLGSFDGKSAFLNKGPYGPYIKFAKEGSKDSIKNLPLPKNFSVDGISSDVLSFIFNLPKVICFHNKYKEDIILHLSKFGFYLKCSDKISQIKDCSFEKLPQIDEKMAIRIINDVREKKHLKRLKTRSKIIKK